MRLLWTNYDIDEEFVECTSLNYLSTYLYKAASLPLPEYNLFLEKVEKQIPMINSQGYYSLSKQCFLSISDAEGEEKKLLSVVDSIFASGYLTADGQGIQDTIKTIEDAGFTYEIESA